MSDPSSYNLSSRNAERRRYDLKASFTNPSSVHKHSYDIYHSFPISEYKLPFLSSLSILKHISHPKSIALELGSGTGLHTIELSTTFSRVYAVDISTASLDVLTKLDISNIYPLNASIDDLPVLPSSIDCVVSYGSISYADPSKVFAEVNRILRNRGYFLIVDTLSGNPIYTLNRFMHLILRRRSFLQTSRLLSIRDIYNLSNIHDFQIKKLSFFGKYLWLKRIIPTHILEMPIVSRLFDILESFTPDFFAFKYLVLLQSKAY